MKCGNLIFFLSFTECIIKQAVKKKKTTYKERNMTKVQVL